MLTNKSTQKIHSSDNGNASADTIATEKRNAESHAFPLLMLKKVQLTTEYNIPLKMINRAHPSASNAIVPYREEDGLLAPAKRIIPMERHPSTISNKISTISRLLTLTSFDEYIWRDEKKVVNLYINTKRLR